MHGPAILDHFQNPRNAGELPPPAVTAELSNPVCGDTLRLSALIGQGTVQQIRFKARGCVASIACASALTELVQHRPVEDAARLSADDVSAALGGLPPESGHAVALAIEALQDILKRAQANRR